MHPHTISEPYFKLCAVSRPDGPSLYHGGHGFSGFQTESQIRLTMEPFFLLPHSPFEQQWFWMVFKYGFFFVGWSANHRELCAGVDSQPSKTWYTPPPPKKTNP